MKLFETGSSVVYMYINICMNTYIYRKIIVGIESAIIQLELVSAHNLISMLKNCIFCDALHKYVIKRGCNKCTMFLFLRAIQLVNDRCVGVI